MSDIIKTHVEALSNLAISPKQQNHQSAIYDLLRSPLLYEPPVAIYPILNDDDDGNGGTCLEWQTFQLIITNDNHVLVFDLLPPHNSHVFYDSMCVNLLTTIANKSRNQ
jgi:hypothetical protein